MVVTARWVTASCWPLCRALPAGHGHPINPPVRAGGLRASPQRRGWQQDAGLSQSSSSSSFLRALSSLSFPAVLPSPSRTQSCRGRSGAVALAFSEQRPWARSWLSVGRSPLGRQPGIERRPGPGCPRSPCPRRVYFSCALARRWAASPGGRALINVLLSLLFSGRSGSCTAWETGPPAPIAMETSLRPWETFPGLSFPPPKKKGSEEGGETSGPALPKGGGRHDARVTGTVPLPPSPPWAHRAGGRAACPAGDRPCGVLGEVGTGPSTTTGVPGLAPVPNGAGAKGWHPNTGALSARELPGENSWRCRQPRHERGKTRGILLLCSPQKKISSAGPLPQPWLC